MLIIKFGLLSLIFATPFWKAKPKVYERVKQGEIIVSAKLTEKEDKKYLKLISAGHIKASKDFTWQEILKFEQYNQIADNFRNIRHEADKKKVYLEMGAMGYYAKLWIDYSTTQTAAKNSLEWKVVKGGFKGLSGDLSVEAFDENVAEISIHGDMLAEVIPIPNALLKIGLEFVGKIMAKKMRQFIENKYQTADIY